MFEHNPFKNEQGIHYTKALFIETNVTDMSQAMYTLKPYDHTYRGKEYPSLRKIYVTLEDPTEYLIATEYLDGWDHWCKLKDSTFFQEHLRAWREELDVRLKAKALLKIRESAKSESKEAFQANKFLVSGGWQTKEDKQAVGRPTKQKIKEEADKMVKQMSEFDDDFERILGSRELN